MGLFLIGFGAGVVFSAVALVVFVVLCLPTEDGSGRLT
jgi:hypothetical protein